MAKNKKENIPQIKEEKEHDVFNSFSQQQNKSDMNEILKELFNKTKIEMITDLSISEIKLITKIKMVSKIKNIKIYDEGVKMFMELKLSQKRLSRRELIDAVKGFYQTLNMDRQGIKKNLLL